MTFVLNYFVTREQRNKEWRSFRLISFERYFRSRYDGYRSVISTSISRWQSCIYLTRLIEDYFRIQNRRFFSSVSILYETSKYLDAYKWECTSVKKRSKFEQN